MQHGADEFRRAHTYEGVPQAQTLTEHTSIVAWLRYRAANDGAREFLTAVNAAGDAETLTFAELDQRSGRLASWCREQGLGDGNVVALAPTNDTASVTAIFGLMRAGCAVLLLNPADPPGRVREQIDAIGAERIFDIGAAGIPALEAPSISSSGTMGDSLPGNVQPASHAEALYFGTSGSTAASKLVAQTHYNAAINAEALRRHHRLVPGDRILGCLPIHHVNGLHFTVFGALAAGAHVMLAHAFDPFAYPKLIEQFRPRIASVVPSILEALLATWRRRSLPSEFDYFVSAAAPLAARTAGDVLNKIGARVLQGYGLTETTNFSTTMPPDLSDREYVRLMVETEIPSIGVAMYGNEVAVLDESGTPVAPGTTGEICMRGHNVMKCYARNPAATAEAFRDGWFHSQDLGFAIADPSNERNYIVITGRTKNIAKVRGETVSLDEMDRVLRSSPDIIDAACATVVHRMLGEEIVAAVVLAPGAGQADSIASIRRRLGDAFAAAVVPNRIEMLDAIPRTPTGKLRRAELAQILTERP